MSVSSTSTVQSSAADLQLDSLPASSTETVSTHETVSANSPPGLSKAQGADNTLSATSSCLGGAGGTARCSSLLISDHQLSIIYATQGAQPPINALIGLTDYWANAATGVHELPFPETGPYTKYQACLGGGWGSPDSASVQFLMADGRVRSISYGVANLVMAAMITPDQSDSFALEN